MNRLLEKLFRLESDERDRVFAFMFLGGLLQAGLAIGLSAADSLFLVHVGPDPNLIPATFKRLSDNVEAQLTGYSPGKLSKRVVSHLVRRPWLTKLLPSRTALLRAPFIEHVILEDWLLEQMPTR